MRRSSPCSCSPSSSATIGLPNECWSGPPPPAYHHPASDPWMGHASIIRPCPAAGQAPSGFCPVASTRPTIGGVWNPSTILGRVDFPGRDPWPQRRGPGSGQLAPGDVRIANPPRRRSNCAISARISGLGARGSIEPVALKLAMGPPSTGLACPWVRGSRPPLAGSSPTSTTAQSGTIAFARLFRTPANLPMGHLRPHGGPRKGLSVDDRGGHACSPSSFHKYAFPARRHLAATVPNREAPGAVQPAATGSGGVDAAPRRRHLFLWPHGNRPLDPGP